MEKQKLYDLYENIKTDLNLYVILLVLTKNIIDQVEGDIELEECKFDLQEIEMLYCLPVEKLTKFQNKILYMFENFKLKELEVDQQELMNIFQQIQEHLKKSLEKNTKKIITEKPSQNELKDMINFLKEKTK